MVEGMDGDIDVVEAGESDLGVVDSEGMVSDL